ncbi:MAG: PmoA family protein [Planctomycetes bacterium]|nr:PmoA family protein [Planctomycetota bacterium]
MRCLFALLTLSVLPAFARADDVSIVVGKDAVEFKAGSAVVARYAVAGSVAKPYLYPVLAPNGTPLTRGYPVDKAPGDATTDHIHQKSVWFCHGDVIPEGIELKVKSANKADKGVDFWSETKDKDGSPRHGKIKCVKVEKPVQHAKNHASVETHNEWFTPDGVKIMEEVRVIHFVDTKEGRLFAFDITLKAPVCPITFGDTKEGSFGIRVNDAFRPSQSTGATVTTAEGKTVVPPAKDNLPIWGYPTDWIDYSGKFEGKEAGIAVFDHPKNPRANWHVRAYGLNAANPFGREHSGFPTQKGKTDLMKIAKGGEMKLRYAVYAHDGDAKTGKVAEAFAEFKK